MMTLSLPDDSLIDDNGASFLLTIDTYINHAMQFLSLPEGLAERIRDCNSTYRLYDSYDGAAKATAEFAAMVNESLDPARIHREK